MNKKLAPAISTAHGPGPFGAIKPDLLAYGGKHDVRTVAAGDNLRVRVIRESGTIRCLRGGGERRIERSRTRARNELRCGVDNPRSLERGR